MDIKSVIEDMELPDPLMAFTLLVLCKLTSSDLCLAMSAIKDVCNYLTPLSIFKQSTPGLNSEFSVSYTSCLTKARECCLPYYSSISMRKTNEFRLKLSLISELNRLITA